MRGRMSGSPRVDEFTASFQHLALKSPLVFQANRIHYRAENWTNPRRAKPSLAIPVRLTPLPAPIKLFPYADTMFIPKLGGGHEAAQIYCAPWWRESRVFGRFARAIASGAMKKRRGMTTEPKPHNAAKAARRRKDSVPDAGEEIALLKRNLNEAVEQQTATSEVLRVISSSPGELEPVFQAMLENAVRICCAEFGVLWLCKDRGVQVAATHGIPTAYREQIQLGVVLHPGASLPIARAASARQAVHIADLRTDQAYLNGEPAATAAVELGQIRTLLAVPR